MNKLEAARRILVVEDEVMVAWALEDMAKQLTNRLTALGRAHDLVRPLSGHAKTDALLGDLLTVLLAPYDDLGAFSGRIRVSVPRRASEKHRRQRWR
jgi:hypothetical protein